MRELGRKRIFCVFRAQETCLEAAIVVLPRNNCRPIPVKRYLTARRSPISQLDLIGHFEAREREGERNEGKGQKGEKTPLK